MLLFCHYRSGRSDPCRDPFCPLANLRKDQGQTQTLTDFRSRRTAVVRVQNELLPPLRHIHSPEPMRKRGPRTDRLRCSQVVRYSLFTSIPKG